MLLINISIVATTDKKQSNNQILMYFAVFVCFYQGKTGFLCFLEEQVNKSQQFGTNILVKYFQVFR